MASITDSWLKLFNNKLISGRRLQCNDGFIEHLQKKEMNRRICILLNRITGRNDKAIAYDYLDLPGYPRSAANTATQTYKEP